MYETKITIHLLFIHCSYIVHVFKNIKNDSHGTIYLFKNQNVMQKKKKRKKKVLALVNLENRIKREELD